MSIRQTRVDYMDSITLPQRRMTREQFAKLWTRRMKKALLAKGLVKYTPKKRWLWDIPGNVLIGGVVEAHTRSEARAQIKANLGINKGRLPIGITIYEVMPERDGAA